MKFKDIDWKSALKIKEKEFLDIWENRKIKN